MIKGSSLIKQTTASYSTCIPNLAILLHLAETILILLYYSRTPRTARHPSLFIFWPRFFAPLIRHGNQHSKIPATSSPSPLPSLSSFPSPYPSSIRHRFPPHQPLTLIVAQVPWKDWHDCTGQDGCRGWNWVFALHPRNLASAVAGKPITDVVKIAPSSAISSSCISICDKFNANSNRRAADVKVPSPNWNYVSVSLFWGPLSARLNPCMHPPTRSHKPTKTILIQWCINHQMILIKDQGTKALPRFLCRPLSDGKLF